MLCSAKSLGEVASTALREVITKVSSFFFSIRITLQVLWKALAMLPKLTTDCLASSNCNFVVCHCYCEEFRPTDKWKWKHCKSCAKSWWCCRNWPPIVWSVHTVIWLSAIVTVKSFDLQISGSGNCQHWGYDGCFYCPEGAVGPIWSLQLQG